MLHQDDLSADDENEFAAALQAFGLVQDAGVPGAAAKASGEVCEVLEEHMDAFNTFLACLTQLQRSVGLGGLYFAAARSTDVRAEMVWLGLDRARQAVVVQQYRVMESEALHILNKR